MKWWQIALLLVGAYFIWEWWSNSQSSASSTETASLPAQNPSNPLFTYPYGYGGGYAPGTPQGTDTTGIGFGSISPWYSRLPFSPAMPWRVTDYGAQVQTARAPATNPTPAGVLTGRPRPVGPARRTQLSI